MVRVGIRSARSCVAWSRLWLALSLSLALLCVVTPAAAEAQGTSSCSSPTISFASTATLVVPIGAGSVIPPAVTASCAGTAASDPDVTASLSGSAGVVWSDIDRALSQTFAGNGSGVVSLPIITSQNQSGSFTVTVSFNGASATLAGMVTGTLSGILPPDNPSSALAVDEDKDPTCSGPADVSTTCLDESLALINAGRASESLGPVELPSNWASLSVDDQLLVMTDLERTARGLPPESGLADDWDQAAQSGADQGVDPSAEGGWSADYQASPEADGSFEGSGFSSVEDPDQPNAIMAMVAWVYTDGIFPDGQTGNADCSASDTTGCWGHRDAELNDAPDMACELQCAIGAGYSATGFQGDGESYTEVFGLYTGNNADPLTFTWASELPDLPACEQAGDTCAWSGQPLMTTSGYENVPGVGGQGTSGSGGAGSGTTPTPVAQRISLSRVTRHGRRITLTVHFLTGSGTVSATATSRGRIRRTLARHRLSAQVATLSATLPPGHWTLTLRYTAVRGYSAHAPSHVGVTIP